MSNHPSIESPRLRALNEALERSEAGALESFWDEMKERGTPLIESVEGDDENSLVTFLWRAGDRAGNRGQHDQLDHSSSRQPDESPA